ncbi:unnamed protein product [Moneuplotes crassus]|uniref:Lipase n=1 Tax=Euplotes crassus TaxID=5936 RepID=A0AAD1UMZ7_EUPCR|nr:unnamed protein product [Moneuplotes crassus]
MNGNHILILLIVTIFLLVYKYDTQPRKRGQINIPKVLHENKTTDEDAKRSFSRICRSKGYPFKKYKVLTEDGYWLTLFRIYGTKNEDPTEALQKSKPAVFFQHGVVDSADTFIMNDEDKSPAFMTANAGYDVWLGNSRGNKYNREHQWLDPDDPEEKYVFFDYSFEEMAKYDVPAFIDFILNITGKEKLAVLGHSQGATTMLVKMSEDIDWWNKHVSIFACLGGVGRLQHTSSKLVKDLANQNLLLDAVKRLGVVEICYHNYYQSLIFSTICSISPSLCNFLIELVADASSEANNHSRVDVFMAHYPSGSSLKSFEHFAQIIVSGKFQKFDNGALNLQVYNQTTPPKVDLKAIKDTKIIQIVGTADHLSPVEDNLWLKSELGSNVVFYEQYFLGHTSFLLANDMQFMKDVLHQFEKNKWD